LDPDPDGDGQIDLAAPPVAVTRREDASDRFRLDGFVLEIEAAAEQTLVVTAGVDPDPPIAAGGVSGLAGLILICVGLSLLRGGRSSLRACLAIAGLVVGLAWSCGRAGFEIAREAHVMVEQATLVRAPGTDISVHGTPLEGPPFLVAPRP
jgi:hypothetical protein